MDKLIDSKRRPVIVMDILDSTATSVLLRSVYFLNDERTRYVSVGFFPTEKYKVLVEFGGPHIAPITLTEQHVRTLMEHLAGVCKVMQSGEL